MSVKTQVRPMKLGASKRECCLASGKEFALTTFLGFGWVFETWCLQDGVQLRFKFGISRGRPRATGPSLVVWAAVKIACFHAGVGFRRDLP